MNQKKEVKKALTQEPVYPPFNHQYISQKKTQKLKSIVLFSLGFKYKNKPNTLYTNSSFIFLLYLRIFSCVFEGRKKLKSGIPP